MRWMDFAGFCRSFAELPDPRRWEFTRRYFSLPMPPPPETVHRAQSLPNLRLHLDSPIEAVSMDNGRIRLATPKGCHLVDYVILGTGFIPDLRERPELSSIIDDVALWRDRYLLAGRGDDPVAEEIAGYPYLGPSFEFMEKQPGCAPHLGRIHIVNGAGVPSLGGMCDGVNGKKFTVARLVRGLIRDLYLEDQARTGKGPGGSAREARKHAGR